jgi:hypothetical protein
LPCYLKDAYRLHFPTRPTFARRHSIDSKASAEWFLRSHGMLQQL